MQIVFVAAIRDVETLVSGDWVRVDGLRWSNRMLPFFLHLSMHDEEAVMWEMNRYLTLSIR